MQLYPEFSDCEGYYLEYESESEPSSETPERAAFTPGQIVKIHDCEFAGELAQVVAIDEEGSQVLAKLYAHIDYAALGPGRTSQRFINNTSPVNYRAPTAAFDVAFFERLGMTIPFAEISIGHLNIRTHFWDGDHFIGKFMYRPFHVDDLAELDKTNGITAMEKYRFTTSVAPFEEDLPGFLETMESTPVSSGVKRHLNFQERFVESIKWTNGRQS
jgi:hypothetical protein